MCEKLHYLKLKLYDLFYIVIFENPDYNLQRFHKNSQKVL